MHLRIIASFWSKASLQADRYKGSPFVLDRNLIANSTGRSLRFMERLTFGECCLSTPQHKDWRISIHRGTNVQLLASLNALFFSIKTSRGNRALLLTGCNALINSCLHVTAQAYTNRGSRQGRT